MLAVFFPLSVLIAYTVTQLSIRISLRSEILDLPTSRSSHSRPIPRIGGTGIVTGFCLSLIAFFFAGHLGLVANGFSPRHIVVVITVGLGVATIGLYDDLRGLSPLAKIGLQLPLAALLIAYGVSVESVSLPFVKPLSLGVLAIPCTALWLIGFSNIFNFMDGINGLAGGTGVVYGIFFSLLAWRQGDHELAAVAILLAGSSLGFLFHNFPRPHTFMGDTGSVFLGMLFAYLVVRLGQGLLKPVALTAAILVCSVFLYDSGFTLIKRIWRGENIFQAHRSHLYQKLVQAGVSHGKVTGLYLVLHSIMGSVALAYLGVSEATRLEILSLVCLIFLLFTVGVARVEQHASS